MYNLDPVTACVWLSLDISNMSGVAATPANQLLISLDSAKLGVLYKHIRHWLVALKFELVYKSFIFVELCRQLDPKRSDFEQKALQNTALSPTNW